MVVSTYNPALERWRPEDLWGLVASQPAQLTCEFQGSERLCVQKKEKWTPVCAHIHRRHGRATLEKTKAL